MLNFVPKALNKDMGLSIGWLGLAGLLIFIGGGLIVPLVQSLLPRFISLQFKEAYQKVMKPYEGWLGVAIGLLLADIAALLLPGGDWSRLLEIPIGLALTITASWLASRLFKQVFDGYLLEVAIKSGRKVNSELLILTKLIANVTITVIAIIIFAQTHQINVLGLVASLGISGLAVAFAAQTTLEQVIGGIVIYLDRPFVVDDYIGLPDGTFGRVESIGLRSTKIRTSGKGTLVIVPNSSLTEVNIENFTGAKKVMAIIYLNFYSAIKSEEQALIRQVILESTVDIFGIDTRSTDVIFRDSLEQTAERMGVSASASIVTPEALVHAPRTQAQITFFILGSSAVSMELRRQLLAIANQNITRQLKGYGIAFDVDEPTIYVDSPITI